jgi:hypothetical protein
LLLLWLYGSFALSASVRKGGGSLNVSTAVTSLITEWFHFIQWLWQFADSIIVYQGITLLDIVIFVTVASLVLDVVVWVNSKSLGDDE